MANPLSGTSVATLKKSLTATKIKLRQAWRQLRYRRRRGTNHARRNGVPLPSTVICTSISRLRSIHRQVTTNGFHDEIDTDKLYRTIRYHERKRDRLIPRGQIPKLQAYRKHGTFNRRHSETNPPLPCYYEL